MSALDFAARGLALRALANAGIPRFATLAEAMAGRPAADAPVQIDERDNARWQPTALDYPATHPSGEGVWWYEDAAGTVRVIDEPRISLTHLGGVGDDGATDNSVAWQELFKAGKALGREIRVPKAPGYFKVTRPGYSYNGMTLRMAGDVRNTRLNTDPGFVYGQHFCVLFGNWYGDLIHAGAATTKYAVLATVNKGDQSFTVSPADAANFAAGDVVILYTSGAMVPFGGTSAQDKPERSDVNEVKAVNAGTGVVTLVYPVKETIDSTPKVINGYATGVSDLLGNPVRWVKDVTVINEGGSFASEYERWTGYGGMVRARISAFVKKTWSLFSVNAVVHSEINISGFFTNTGFEIAYLSQDSLIQSSTGANYDGAASAQTNPVVTVSELARRITVGNLRGTTAASGVHRPQYLLTFTGAKDCVVRGDVRLQGGATVALVDCQAASAGTFGGHRFLPGSVFLGDAGTGLRFTTSGGVNSDIVVDGITLRGTFSAFGINLKGDDIIIRNVYHETGNVTVQSGSNRTTLANLRSAAARTIIDSGASTQRDNNYDGVAGIKRTEGLRTINLADDTAFSIQAPAMVGLVEVGYGAAAASTGRAIFKTNNPSMTAIGTPGANVNFLAAGGALAGTTSIDGRLSVSCHTDGKLYIENRTGAAQDVWVKF